MWSLIKATAIRDGGGRPILAINVIEDVTEQREREQELRFLADTGKVLAGSIAWERTFPEIARLVVARPRGLVRDRGARGRRLGAAGGVRALRSRQADAR